MKTKPLIIPFLLFSSFSFAQNIGNRTFYLSNKGDDSFDGSSKVKPWKSLAKLNAINFEPGDKILLEGGSTFIGKLQLSNEDEGLPDNPVIIESYGLGKAIIQNPDSTAIRIWNAGGIAIHNISVQGIDRTKNKGNGIEVLNTFNNADKRKYIRIENCSASSFGGDGIYLGGNPSDGSQSGFEDVRISFTDVFDNQFHGIFVTGVWDTHSTGYANNHVRIDHCNAYNNTGNPSFLDNHSGSGMEIDDVENTMIEYCTAYNNGYLCNSKVGGPCGIWLHAANNTIIQYCTAINNRTGDGLDGAGFDLDGGTTHCTIQYCYARDNDGAGILVWNYDQAPHRLEDNIIRHNILENNGLKNSYGEIHIGTSGTPIQNMTIENNTIFSSAQPGTEAKCLTITYGTNRNFSIKRNLFISNGVTSLMIDKEQPGLDIAGNAYWSVNGGISILENKQVYTSLSTWQKLTLHEMINGKSIAITVNPLLDMNSTETPSPDKIAYLKAYQPKANSPLLKNKIGALPFR